MEKVYDISVAVWGCKNFKVKAPNARIAVEMLLNMYFNSDLVKISNEDIGCMDIVADTADKKEVSTAACVRCKDGFKVRFDGDETSKPEETAYTEMPMR